MQDSVRFLISPEDYAGIVQRQRDYLEGLAARIESGEAIDDSIGMKVAAGAIRAFAASIPDKQKGKQGPSPKFCHGSEALVYAAYRSKGMPHGEALASIADRVGVSEVAVEKAIRKHRADAFNVVGIPDPGNQ